MTIPELLGGVTVGELLLWWGAASAIFPGADAGACAAALRAGSEASDV